MSKTARIKSDLDDITSLVEIISILKDVSSNNFYSAATRKEKFAEFALAFTDFFRMISLSEAKSPLVHSQNETTAILPITWDGGFMADMTAKVIRTSFLESERCKAAEFIVIGRKGAEKIRSMSDKKMTVFTGIQERGMFAVTLEIKDYIIEQAKKGSFSKVVAVAPRAKSMNLIKPIVVKLLPSEELLTKQMEIKDAIEKVIVESDINDIIDYLADIWLTCRLYEMIQDCVIASFAAQTQQLEASLEQLKKERKGLAMGFQKAKKADIDKSLREVFTAKTMTSSARK